MEGADGPEDRRRKPRRRRVALAVAAGAILLAVVVELAAPARFADGIQARIDEATRGEVGVEVTVVGPPVVLPAVATGRVGWIRLGVTSVVGREPPVGVTLQLDDVRVARASVLVSPLRVESIGTATVDLTIPLDRRSQLLAELAERLGRIGLEQLSALADVLAGHASEGGGPGHLRLGGGVDLELGRGGCEIAVDPGQARVTCQLVEVPQLLLRALQ